MTAEHIRTKSAAVLAGVLAVGAVVLAACTSSGGTATAPTLPPSSSSVTTTPASSSPSAPGSKPATSSATRRTIAPVKTSASAPHPTSTSQVTVRPVTSGGTLAAGWSAEAESTTIDCSSAIRSPVSTSADVLYCQPSADSAIACWHAQSPAFAYCLTDPRSHSLIRYALQGSKFPAAGPTELEPRPSALDLADGTQCSVRDGGAAGALDSHPDWVPYYFCGSQAQQAVWAAPDSVTGGITHGDGPWTVQVTDGGGAGPLRTVDVVKAYYDGTA